MVHIDRLKKVFLHDYSGEWAKADLRPPPPPDVNNEPQLEEDSESVHSDHSMSDEEDTREPEIHQGIPVRPPATRRKHKQTSIWTKNVNKPALDSERPQRQHRHHQAAEWETTEVNKPSHQPTRPQRQRKRPARLNLTALWHWVDAI